MREFKNRRVKLTVPSSNYLILKGRWAREDLNLRPMDYEITSPCWENHGLPGCKPIINLTLTSFVTSRSLIRTRILIFGGNGKLARFNIESVGGN